MRLIKKLKKLLSDQKVIQQEITDLKMLKGKQLAEMNNLKNSVDSLHQVEFKVFSQWGDDGIIQYLIHKIKIENKYFIEFGVENYLESNTRFLLMNNNWSGLVMDGSKKHIDFIQNDSIYWKYDLAAKNAFITAENINQLISEEGINGNIGLLHIDIDGNDYWVWKAINTIRPDIVIVEYNSVFGIEKPITVPYQPDFVRTKSHFSNLYFGVSLLALCDLAEEKGYDFVGTNQAGNNAYFVIKNKSNNLKVLTPEEGFVISKFKEGRDKQGHLTLIRGKERKTIIQGLEVFNTRTKEIEKL